MHFSPGKKKNEKNATSATYVGPQSTSPGSAAKQLCIRYSNLSLIHLFVAECFLITCLIDPLARRRRPLLTSSIDQLIASCDHTCTQVILALQLFDDIQAGT